ncbi:RNA polymerase sigma factor [Natranaerofaba carboxydovora]|uniref:RNA polymerase sigma factor n=1 Tax=Natranaerofaba carboxydovora TaxID=2742683 RepID=UPI001F13FB12|nr:sigma-70 family RNA polymerase sigma factor [Natranaerofaba carboxydovora]UMZ74805.1 ECF RNA polymerase sigma factor SigW [Natranaerofaba carboxydovora]
MGSNDYLTDYLSDEKIVKKILEYGDSSFYSEIVNRYSKGILTLTKRMVKNSQDAEDLAQESFIKAYQKLDTFDAKYKFSTWIYKIATNTCLDYLKKKKDILLKDDDSMQKLESTNGSEGPEENLIQKEQLNYMEKAIKKLPHEFRAVVVLYHINGFNYKEIAEILDINQSKVKNRLFKGRKLLQKELVFLKEVDDD